MIEANKKRAEELKKVGPGDFGTWRDYLRDDTAPDVDRRALAEKEAELGRQAEAERRKRALATRRLADLDIPAEYERATFASFKLHGSQRDREIQRRAHQMALRWVGEWPREWAQNVLSGERIRLPFSCGVPLLQVWRGGPGTGKNHLIYAIARELAERHAVQTEVVKLADLVRELRASWTSKKAKPEAVVLKEYRAHEWLVIDEVSRHAFKGDARQHIYDVVDNRMEHRLPSILVTNEPEAALADFLDEALISRINGQGGIIEFGTADFRQLERE